MPFDGGKRGCLGLVYIPVSYLAETLEVWTVPVLEGAYPAFTTNTTEDKKKKEILEFIKREKNIKRVKVVKELSKGMFLEAIDKYYTVKLKHELRE